MPLTSTIAGFGLGFFLLSFLLSMGLCALVIRFAGKLGFLDRPGGHKGHQSPTPLGGGVAIWLVTVSIPALGALILLLGESVVPAELGRHAAGVKERGLELVEILGLSTAIMIMGLVDDRRALGWRPRLGIQIGLAVILAASGIRVTLFGPFAHPMVGGFVTVLWVVGLTNAFNFLDNMDGLAGGVGLLASLLFIGAQVAAGGLFAPAVLLGLVGALAGFLAFNRSPAQLFMGDAGSNFLGFLLGAMTVAGTYYRHDGEGSPYGVLAPLLVMAVPLYDSTSVILIRLREGRSPFQADRRHFSHRLVDRGLTRPQAVRTILLVTLAGGLGALLLHRLDATGAVVVVAQTLCVLGVVAVLEAVGPPPGRPLDVSQVPEPRND